MNKKVGGSSLFDEFIDAGDWYKLDVTKAATGDSVLFLGKSLGSVGEFSLAFYIYKLLSRKKPEVILRKDIIGSQLRAGKIIPFTAIVYLPFVKGRFDFETGAYVKKVGGRIFHANNPEELKKVLIGLEEEYQSRNKSRCKKP